MKEAVTAWWRRRNYMSEVCLHTRLRGRQAFTIGVVNIFVLDGVIRSRRMNTASYTRNTWLGDRSWSDDSGSGMNH